MAHSRGSRQGRATSRRLTTWALGPGGSTLTAFTASGEAILGSGVSTALSDTTLIRLRGNIEVIQTLGGAGEGFHMGFGVCVVSLDAFDIGITAVPKPLDDMAWDGWLYHRILDIHSISATIGDGVNSTALVVREEVDSKAMRKLRDHERLLTVCQVVEVGTASINVFFDSRALFKLP